MSDIANPGECSSAVLSGAATRSGCQWGVEKPTVLTKQRRSRQRDAVAVAQAPGAACAAAPGHDDQRQCVMMNNSRSRLAFARSMSIFICADFMSISICITLSCIASIFARFSGDIFAM